MPNIALDSTPQQVADFVVAHLYKQGKPAMEGLTCVYRKFEDDGTCLMCTVGALLTDAEFDLKYNKSSVAYLAKRMRKHRPQAPTDFYVRYLDLLGSLQRVHDEWLPEGSDTLVYNFSSLIHPLKRVYARYNLSLPEILKTE